MVLGVTETSRVPGEQSPQPLYLTSFLTEMELAGHRTRHARAHRRWSSVYSQRRVIIATM